MEANTRILLDKAVAVKFLWAKISFTMDYIRLNEKWVIYSLTEDGELHINLYKAL